MKRINLMETYNANDCTSTGYSVEIAKRKDKSFSIVFTNRTRYQGSSSGNEYWFDGFDSMERLIDHIEDFEPIHFLIEKLESELYSGFKDFRLGKKGYLVQ